MRLAPRCVFAGILLLATAVPCLAQKKASPETIKLNIEAAEWDKKLLFEKLNVQGPGHALKFGLADSDFDYRVAFALTRGELDGSRATATVYDAKGSELFGCERQRFTDPKATEAVAKEIIKRLRQLRVQAPK